MSYAHTHREDSKFWGARIGDLVCFVFGDESITGTLIHAADTFVIGVKRLVKNKYNVIEIHDYIYEIGKNFDYLIVEKRKEDNRDAAFAGETKKP